MEGAKLIIEEINREAEQKIRYILSEAEKQAEEIKAEAEKRARAKAEWILRKAQTQAEIEKQRIVANAKLEIRKKRLALQEELINEVLKSLKERLAALPKDEYFEVVKDLMLQAVKELGEDKIRVSSNEATLQLIAEKIDEIKTFLNEKTGREMSIELGDKIETIGGVLVENADRTIRVDNTFEARIERLESELRSRIAKVLFG
ncbi:V-type ATP synthase subunit E [Thermococcus sp. M39]|uniref:V-type ATP synthase subunit E n=1 Tax=unclassified Thermococcus TaxID=2627626 RepID=UPI00143B6F2E|nr:MULTISPECIES: V-type ATP synthase subunit E [unclassified Thermococcus]NJE08238.1 V-type ATP synthase subunit E [Thermococcus sp. M39]NJE11731.1 V-type ATP synthase subunit E [Thermococcus sp. LS2]